MWIKVQHTAFIECTFIQTQIRKSIRKMFEGFPAISILVRKKCEQIIAPPFHFYHLPTQVPKSSYCLKDSESAIILAPLFWGLAHTDRFVSKKPNIWKFSIRVQFETWTLKYQKSIFLKTFGLFGTWYEKMCPFFFENQYIINF